MNQPPGHANPGSSAFNREEVLARFEKVWQEGGPPRLEQYLPTAGPERRRLLEELVAIDLEYRWSNQRGGKPWGLEDYIARFPELGPLDRLPLELILEEYQVRQRWGDRPGHAVYAERFPQHGPTLRDQLAHIDAELAAEFAQPPGKNSLLASKPPPGPATIDTVADLVAALRQHQLLSPPQLADLGSPSLRGFTGPMALGKELLRRAWLTPYQVNQLMQGRVHDLLFGPYLLLERLGEGGAGQVFKARHQKMDRIVALKVIRKELLADTDVVSRFYREIQVLSQLDHPNIVRAYDAGPNTRARGHFLAMEFIEGTDLGRLVKQGGPMPIIQACEYIRQAALGLQYAHERGLVHRDIKPHNLIMSVRDGLVKVADLGLARLPRAGPDELTGVVRTTGTLTPENAVMIGTADYLAPEQALNFHEADIRADIYSLGCTLFFLIAGQAPFAGGTLAQKVAKHLQAEPPPIDKFRSDVPPALSQMLRRMLAKRPEDRYQTPGELAAMLVELVPKGAESPNVQAREPGLALSARLRALLPQGRRRFWAAAVALLMVAVIVFLSLLPRPRSPGNLLPPRSPLDALDAKTIPAGKLPAQPVEGLVAVLGEVGGPSAPALAFSKDDQLLAVAWGRAVLLWRFGGAEPKPLTPLTGHQQDVLSLAFSPDSRILASSGDTTVRLWDVGGDSPNERSVIREHDKQVEWVAFAPDGKTLASVSRDDGVVRIWDVSGATPKRKPDVPSGKVNRMAFAPKGMTLATAEVAQRVRFFDLVGGDWRVRPYDLPYGGEAQHVDFAGPEGDIMAAASSGQALLWTIRGPAPKQLRAIPGSYPTAAFAPNGNVLAGTDGQRLLRISEVVSGMLLKETQLPLPIQRLAFAADGRHLAVGNSSGTIYVLRLPASLKPANK
jgi:serine/threonine protein kinase